jgi:class 3 adenylate cyclase
MTRLEERELDARLEELERARSWSPRIIAKLEALLRSEDDAALLRVNPRVFASKHGIAEDEAIELFLHATHVGLFEMAWSLVCPQCTDVVEEARSLCDVGETFHCHICRTTMRATLDDHLHVGFTVSPRIRRIAHHDPDALDAHRWLFEYKMSPEGVFPDGTPVNDFLVQRSCFTAFLAAGETRTFAFDAPPEHALVAFDLTTDMQAALMVLPSAPASAELSYTPGACSPCEGAVAPGPVTVTVTNAGSSRVPFGMIAFPASLTRGQRLEFPRVLTAQGLLTTQAFRTLFASETLRDEGLGVEDVTLVFTDLRGSTELYDRLGDLQAFALVRRHFDALGRAIAHHHGAIVKTVGDAVMAVFRNPGDAVSAALGMAAAVDEVNGALGVRELVLKIGVHRGPAIGVTANGRVDYFGQTVNIAARVQSRAGADEVWVTDAVRKHRAVAELPALDERVEHVKGVRRPLALFRLR